MPKYSSCLFATALLLSAGALHAHRPLSPGEWSISGDYLYLLTTVDDTYFALQSPVITAFPNGTRVNNDFDFSSGFRVGLGFGLCECGREIRFDYARLSASHDRHLSGSFLWATLGRPNFTSNFEHYTGSTSSDLDSLYQAANGLFSQEISFCENGSLFVEGGAEFAYLHLKENYLYQVVDGPVGTISQTSNMWGVGPQLGLSLDYEFYRSSCGRPTALSFVGGSSASLLTSKTHTADKQVLNGSTVADYTDEHTWRVIPAFHARVGLNYDVSLSCTGLSLEVGYEFNSYVRGLTRVLFPDDVADGLCFSDYYNYDLQGLYVSAALAF